MEKKNKLIENVLQFVPVLFMSPWKNSHPDTHFFKDLEFICETQDFYYIESIRFLKMHGNPKFPTFFFFFVAGIGLKTQEDSYEMKFRLN